MRVSTSANEHGDRRGRRRRGWGCPRLVPTPREFRLGGMWPWGRPCVHMRRAPRSTMEVPSVATKAGTLRFVTSAPLKGPPGRRRQREERHGEEERVVACHEGGGEDVRRGDDLGHREVQPAADDDDRLADGRDAQHRETARDVEQVRRLEEVHAGGEEDRQRRGEKRRDRDEETPLIPDPFPRQGADHTANDSGPRRLAVNGGNDLRMGIFFPASLDSAWRVLRLKARENLLEPQEKRPFDAVRLLPPPHRALHGVRHGVLLLLHRQRLRTLAINALRDLSAKLIDSLDAELFKMNSVSVAIASSDAVMQLVREREAMPGGEGSDARLRPTGTPCASSTSCRPSSGRTSRCPRSTSTLCRER